jgi:hypothetical protein
MSRRTPQFLSNATALIVLLAIATRGASARPAGGQYVEDPRCDVLANQLLTNELGDVAMFPAVEAIAYHDHRASFFTGVPDDGIANDWTVHITNVSGQAWTNLCFVADLGATIGNADGRVEDTLGAPGVFTDAFGVDSTGVNAPLYHENMVADGIFQPGEEWEFAVTNFGTGQTSTPPVIISPGVFAGSSPLGAMGGLTSGNASLLAVPVPEPSHLAVLGLATAALLIRRRRGPRQSRRAAASVGLILAVALVGSARTASAVPVLGRYHEDPRCDVIANQQLTHELGVAAVFPINEAFLVNLINSPGTAVCVPDDGLPNDWHVLITNVSGQSWTNLFFVADLGVKVGNADGSMEDLPGAPGILTDAFRIDGTVTITGMNDNLVAESGPINEVFEPGETWTFNLTNFVDAFGGASPPTFITPGKFAGSSPPAVGSQGNASILAVPVPEPATTSVIVLSAAALLMRRPCRS